MIFLYYLCSKYIITKIFFFLDVKSLASLIHMHTSIFSNKIESLATIFQRIFPEKVRRGAKGLVCQHSSFVFETVLI